MITNDTALVVYAIGLLAMVVSYFASKLLKQVERFVQLQEHRLILEEEKHDWDRRR